jgi:hypothetical protein
MSTDELIRELIGEIRKDREALAGLSLAVTELGKDFRAFRAKVFENQSQQGERIRAISDFVGMTDPHDSNGA